MSKKSAKAAKVWNKVWTSVYKKYTYQAPDENGNKIMGEMEHKAFCVCDSYYAKSANCSRIS